MKVKPKNISKNKEMEKEKDRVEIKLSSPNNSYFTGQEITGKICFFLTKKTKIRAINLKITGKGKCKWMEIYHKDIRGNANPRNLFYTGNKIFLHDNVNNPHVPARGIELEPGEFSMDFTYLLKQDLPSSFKGSYGSIKYKLKVVIQKPWSFNEKYTIPLTIVRNIGISAVDESTWHSVARQVCRQTSRNVSLFGSGPITVIAKIPQNYAIRNEKLNLHVTVDNCSNIHVDKLRFNIVQKVFYHSSAPLLSIKSEEKIIFTKETGGVEKKTERSFAHDLLIPACPPTHKTYLINIEYFLTVEAILPTFYKNLSTSFQLIIFSRGSDGTLGNPFEEVDDTLGVGIFPINNRASSFINTQTTNSPTHSNSLNESESSSLYSTTSESSTTTLSPAIRSVTDSETISLESIRNIHRRAMGYIHSTARQQSRELPFDRHPPLVEYLQDVYDLPAMNSSYPPPSNSSLPIYHQSSVNFQVQARYPINELPPSYEELFPRARSKSPTAPSPDTPV